MLTTCNYGLQRHEIADVGSVVLDVGQGNKISRVITGFRGGNEPKSLEIESKIPQDEIEIDEVVIG